MLTLKDYCGRILSFIMYIETDYPQYYDRIVVELGPDSDNADTCLKYFGHTRDLNYGNVSPWAI